MGNGRVKKKFKEGGGGRKKGKILPAERKKPPEIKKKGGAFEAGEKPQRSEGEGGERAIHLRPLGGNSPALFGGKSNCASGKKVFLRDGGGREGKRGKKRLPGFGGGTIGSSEGER